MTGTILVPLDESALSEAALPVAVEIASALGDPITLLTAGWGSTVVDLQSYLDRVAQSLDVPSKTLVVPDTFPATAIAKAVADPDDAIVMATHGRSGLGKALLGSVAEDVLKRTDRPVMLVGPRVESPGPLHGGVIILTTDGSPASAAVLPLAQQWATALEMSVHVVTATTPSGIPLGTTAAEDLGRAADGAAAYLREQGIDVTITSVIGVEAAQAITDYADSLPAAIIAMATHGRSGLARTALGSTTMKVTHLASCPVLVQKPAL